MDFASRHACYAADAITEVLNGDDEAAAWARFYQRRDEHALEAYRNTAELANDLRQLLA